MVELNVLFMWMGYSGLPYKRTVDANSGEVDTQIFVRNSYHPYLLFIILLGTLWSLWEWMGPSVSYQVIENLIFMFISRHQYFYVKMTFWLWFLCTIFWYSSIVPDVMSRQMGDVSLAEKATYSAENSNVLS